MHKDIKRFGFEGEAKDNADFARLRAQFELWVTQEMREDGYVPVIGLGPFWSTAYNEKEEKFTFVVSVHGIKVGRKEACLVEGITAEGRTLRLSTTESRSKASSTN